MSYSSPLLSRPDACPAPAQSLDQGVAWHYGEPLIEQRTLSEGEGWVDLSHRAVVTVSGPDRLSWLHSITTNAMDQLLPGQSILNLVLSPNGHVELELHLVDDGSTVWITTEANQVDQLLDYLNRMKFMLRVEIEDVSASYAVFGEPISAVHSDYPTFIWPSEYSREHASDPATAKYVPRRPAVFIGREVVVPRSQMDVFIADRPAIGSWAWEARRIAAGVPRHGMETDHRTIPHEVGWVTSAVHLNKGCYRGQETVARVHNLGRPPRRLVLLHLDGSADAAPVPDAPVSWNGKSVGRVTSVAQHFELGPIALAVIKRSVPEDAGLIVELPTGVQIPASQETIVVSGDV